MGFESAQYGENHFQEHEMQIKTLICPLEPFRFNLNLHDDELYTEYSISF